MAEDDWVQDLEGRVGSLGARIRPELKQNLIDVVNTRRKDIEEFAAANIELDINVIPILTDVVSFEEDQETLALYASAVYFANAKYYEYEIRPHKEKISIRVVPNKGPARHSWDGPWQHIILITKPYLDNYGKLFFALDAETRHVVHQNILNNFGLIDQGSLAARVFCIITETLDEGMQRQGYAADVSPQLDPFINDFFMDGESDGHNGAQYLLRLLSPNRKSKQRQLYWLSRIPIREKAEESNDLIRFEGIVKQLEKGELEVDQKGDVQRVIRFAGSPYQRDINVLLDFYRGAEPQTEFAQWMHEIRKYAIAHLPFIVPESEAVVFAGSQITTFASQLDYVALKLLTSKPQDLYEEAKSKESAIGLRCMLPI